MGDNLALLEELAKRLDAFDSSQCLVVGEKEAEVDGLLRTQGVHPIWASTLPECKKQILSRTIKMVFIVGEKSLGLSLVRWMRKEGGVNLPVILLSIKGGRKATAEEIQEEYPVTVMGCKGREGLMSSYFSGMKNAGVEFSSSSN